MPDQPWFKFFAQDYLFDAKVDALPLAAQGLLVRMWSVCHLEGSCPDDPEELARKTLSKLQDILLSKPLCQSLFELRNGRLYSRRMEEEKRRSEQARVNALRGSKKGTSANGSANGSATSSADGSAKCPAQSQSQSESPLPPLGENDAPRMPDACDSHAVRMRQVEKGNAHHPTQPNQTKTPTPTPTPLGEIGNGKSNPTEFNATEVAIALSQQEGWYGASIRLALADAITHVAAGSVPPDFKAIGEDLVRRWQLHRDTGKFPKDPGTFFSGAHYKSVTPTSNTGPPLITDPVKLAADLLAEDERQNKLLRDRGKEALP